MNIRDYLVHADFQSHTKQRNDGDYPVEVHCNASSQDIPTFFLVVLKSASLREVVTMIFCNPKPAEYMH